MKKILLFVVAMFLAGSAWSTPYFRLLDIHHPETEVSMLYAVKNMAFEGVVTDLALITHSNKDGSIIPQSLQKLGILPEPWVPLQIGIGGSYQTKNAIAHLGTSVNISAFVAGSIIHAVGGFTNPTAKGVADFLTTGLTLANGNEIGFSVGIGVDGLVINDGHFQSLPQMFPGQGLGQILENASCYSLGLAWRM